MYGCVLFQEGDSPVHRCDARMKLLLLVAYSALIVFMDTWTTMAPMALVPAALALWAHLPVRSMLFSLLPVVVLGAFAAAFAIAADPTVHGVSVGLLLAVRMVALVAASLVVCLSTSSTDLLRAFAFFIAPLRIFHVPVDDIAFTLALALRFIPLISEEFMAVRRAQQSRAGDMAGLSFQGRLRMVGNAFVAVLVGLFRHADNVAIAMDARCYGARRKRSCNQPGPGVER